MDFSGGSLGILMQACKQKVCFHQRFLIRLAKFMKTADIRINFP